MMKENKRIIFMGTPLFACAILQTLIDEKYNIVAVVSQPDKKVGRAQNIEMTPVKALALKNGIQVIQPVSIKNDYETILQLTPDCIITCAYGQMIPLAILQAPKFGCINVHASLLPSLRGGAPIHKAIINGFSKTGITIVEMVSKMDAGNMIATSELNIDPDDTMGSLADKLMLLGSSLLAKTLPSILNIEYSVKAQNETEVSFAYNISKEEEWIDFKQTAQVIYNQVRGLIPTPCGYGIIEGKKIKFWKAHLTNFASDELSGTILGFYENGLAIQAGDAILIIEELQLEGKMKVSAKDFYNGQGKNLINKRFEVKE